MPVHNHVDIVFDSGIHNFLDQVLGQGLVFGTRRKVTIASHTLVSIRFRNRVLIFTIVLNGHRRTNNTDIEINREPFHGNRVEQDSRIARGPEKAGALELNGSGSTRLFTTDVGAARHQLTKVANRACKRAQGCRQKDAGHFLCYGHKNLL